MTDLALPGRHADGFWDTVTTVHVSAPAGQLRGIQAHGVTAFRGIPYAEPPIGALRFAAPRRRARFRGTFDATVWGATPQKREPGFAIPEPSVPGDDTLNVTVFAPADALNSAARLPVLVWVHGGRYAAGSPIGDWYDGRVLAAEGVIVVAMTYRLALDGFGSIPGCPDNRAVLDWIAALEWVAENIAAFGGDPDAVTIAGQSAGGGAVLALASTPRARGLFQRVWALSGVLESSPVDIARDQLRRKLAEFGIDHTEEAAQDLDDALVERLDPIDDSLMWLPLDREELFPDGLVEGLRVTSPDIPLVLGATADEWMWDPAEPQLGPEQRVALLTSLGLAPEHHDAAIDAVHRRRGQVTVGGLYTEGRFRVVIPRVLALRGPESRTMVYDYLVPRTGSGVALHCDDIPAFFGVETQSSVRRAIGEIPTAARDQLHEAALAFIRGESLTWAKPTTGVLATATGAAVIGSGPSPSDGFATAEPFTPRFP